MAVLSLLLHTHSHPPFHFHLLYPDLGSTKKRFHNLHTRYTSKSTRTKESIMLGQSLPIIAVGLAIGAHTTWAGPIPRSNEVGPTPSRPRMETYLMNQD